VLAAAVVALLLLFLAWSAFPWGQSESAGQIDRIAVLPLENLTGDAGQEPFAPGMTDAVIANLSQVGLNVLSRQLVGRLARPPSRFPTWPKPSTWTASLSDQFLARETGAALISAWWTAPRE
jgi:hypothetical protein